MLVLLLGIGTKLYDVTFNDTTRLLPTAGKFAGLLHGFKTIGISITPNVWGA
jgi:hypothetical protein